MHGQGGHKKESQIYGKTGTLNLTKYQQSVNDAAFQLCLINGNLLKNKGKLLELAREKVNSEGYNYAKKKRSRSKQFGTGKDLEAEDGPAKRQKMTDEIRQKKVSELCEDIETVTKIVTCLENERVKLANMQKYSQAASVLQQISEKRKEKRKLSDQLASIQAKEVRSKAYHKSKQGSKQVKGNTEVKDASQATLEVFMRNVGEMPSEVPSSSSGDSFLVTQSPKLMVLGE